MRQIIIRTQFVGFHRYLNAPEEVKFLREFHRHIFYVEAVFDVEFANRELEFFIEKKKINNALKRYRDKYFEESCEQVAEWLCSKIGASEVSVFEDDENGGKFLNITL